MSKFSKKEAIKFGWEKTKENFFFFILVMIIFVILSSFPSFFKKYFAKTPPLSFIFGISDLVLSPILTLGLIKITLKIYEGVKPQILDLFSQYRLFFRYLLASILYSIISFLGLLLFILPGIFLGIRLGLFSYLIVDQKKGAFESLKESWKITKGETFNLFLFYLLCAGVSFLGILTFLVGLLVTVPITSLAETFVFKKLAKQEKVGIFERI
jgi:uncharacterized membrane protein